MEYRVRVGLLGAAAVVALGIVTSVVTSTVVAARAYRANARESAKQSQDITVKGSARTRVKSDLGVWKVVLTGEGKSLQDAFEVLEFGSTRLNAFLAEKGFRPEEAAAAAIETQEFHTFDKEGHETQEVASYRLQRAVTVTSAAVERVAGAAGEVTQLLRENVRIASAKPAYYYTKLPDLKVQILGDASRDAKSRADEIARSSGARVTEVRRAQMGVVQITEPNSTEVSGYGMYDTGTIEKDVSVVVTLTLGLSG